MKKQKQPQYYKRIKKLGEGAYGKAYLCQCLSDNQLCVIKQINLRDMSDTEKKATLKESKILEALKHPNIIKFREVYKTKRGKLCIVMNYADGGDLQGLVEKQQRQKIYFREEQILDWFTQICLALKHCHDRKVLHRDLKSQNIFLMKSGLVKLGDFGIARVFQKTNEIAMTMVGTPYYISPEIVNNEAYSFKTDIWSLGVILYELCALKPPFDGTSLPGLAMRIVKGKYKQIPKHYSKKLQDLVAKLLTVKQQRRPSIHDVLKMPLLQNRIKTFLSQSVRIQEFAHTILHNQQLLKKKNRIQDRLKAPKKMKKQQSEDSSKPKVINPIKRVKSQQEKRRKISSRNKKSRKQQRQQLSKAEQDRNRRIYEQIIEKRRREEEREKQRILKEQEIERKKQIAQYNKRKRAIEERNKARKQMKKDIQRKLKKNSKGKKPSNVNVEYMFQNKEESKEEVNKEENKQKRDYKVYNWFQNINEGTQKYQKQANNNQQSGEKQEKVEEPNPLMKSIFLPKNQQEFVENNVLAEQLQALVNEEKGVIQGNDSMQVNYHSQIKQVKNVDEVDREDFDDEISTIESQKQKSGDNIIKKAQKCNNQEAIVQLLIDEYGKENFDKAYKLISEIVNQKFTKKHSFTYIEETYGEKWYDKLLTFIKEEKRDFISFMILTMIIQKDGIDKEENK